MLGIESYVAAIVSRAPHGARGLKSLNSRSARIIRWSRPTRGAWIEIGLEPSKVYRFYGRAPHGARGLKYCCLQKINRPTPVAPHTGRVD